MGRSLAALSAAAGLLAGCASLAGPEGVPASVEEKRAYAAAAAAASEDPAGTEQRLEAFLRTWPESPLADDAGLLLGEIALARGDREAALARFYAMVRSHPRGDRSDAARVRIARLEAERGNPEAAARIMGRTRLSHLSREERRAAYRVLAGVARDPVAKLRWLARLRAELDDPAAIARVDAEIDGMVGGFGPRDLERAASQLGSAVPAARVLTAAAERALEEGELGRARSLLDRAAERPLAEAYLPRLRSAQERLRLREEGPLDAAALPTLAEAVRAGVPATDRATGALGVVVPLSGPLAGLGEESLQGVLLAAGVFDAGGPSVRVLIRDSAGRPERAAEAVRELARHSDVSAIVGPLLSGECEAAAAEAEAAGVPLLALSSREEIARDRRYVFRLRTRPQEEVQILVDYAMRELGAQTFAILYPRDAYGRGLRRLFWDAVEENGGQIVGVAAFDPDATDFAEPIRRLVGYLLLTDEEKQVLEEREEMMRRARRLPPEEALALREEARALTGPDEQPLPPIVDFDALFIPESHEKVVLIAPQLAFHEAVGMRLLGTSGWHHPDLLSIARRHVQGALFTAHFFEGSALAPVRSFVDRYRATFGAQPDVLAAQAFDAASLVLVQLAQGRSSRDAVREGLLDTRNHPGVSGVLSMRADGNARKRPFLLGVERSRMIQVE